MATVAVLLPVKEAQADWLAQAVRSVLAQTHSDLELWIVEAASSRPAEAVLTQFTDPRLRHVLLPESAGLVEQLNEGLRRIAATYVARMDADDLCRPRRLEKQISFLAAHPEVDVVGCQLNVVDQAGRKIGERHYPCDPDVVAAALRRYSALPHPGVMFRRQTIVEAGGYRFPGRPAQDYELWSRLVAAGRKVANVDEVLLDYRMHPASVKARQLREALRATLAVKRMHWLKHMTFGDHLRMTAETAALALPSSVVYWLFTATQLHRTR